MKKNKQEDIIEEVEEVEEEDEPKRGKKKIESVEKRKKAKKKDAIGRWSGVIFLAVVMLIGFLLWVGGEMGNTPTGTLVPAPVNSGYSSSPKDVPPAMRNSTPQPKVIVQ